MGGVIHTMVTRGSCTRDCTVCRRSDVSFGVSAFTAGTAGPRLKVPKYLVMSAFACAGSKSPTMARLALLGA